MKYSKFDVLKLVTFLLAPNMTVSNIRISSESGEKTNKSSEKVHQSGARTSPLPQIVSDKSVEEEVETV